MDLADMARTIASHSGRTYLFDLAHHLLAGRSSEYKLADMHYVGGGESLRMTLVNPADGRPYEVSIKPLFRS